MYVYLCPVKAIVHNQHSSLNSPIMYVVKKGEKLTRNIFIVNMMGQVSTLYVMNLVSYNHFG